MKLLASLQVITVVALGFHYQAFGNLVAVEEFDYSAFSTSGTATNANGGMGWDGTGWTKNTYGTWSISSQLAWTDSNGIKLGQYGSSLTLNTAGVTQSPFFKRYLDAPAAIPTNTSSGLWISFVGAGTGQSTMGLVVLSDLSATQQFLIGSSGTSGATYNQWGIRKLAGGNTFASASVAGVPVTLNSTPVFVVARLTNAGSGNVKIDLWINPPLRVAEPNNTPNATLTLTAGNFTQVAGIGLSVANTGIAGNTQSMRFGCIRIGTCYTDVAPIQTADASLGMVMGGRQVWLHSDPHDESNYGFNTDTALTPRYNSFYPLNMVYHCYPYSLPNDFYKIQRAGITAVSVLQSPGVDDGTTLTKDAGWFYNAAQLGNPAPVKVAMTVLLKSGMIYTSQVRPLVSYYLNNLVSARASGAVALTSGGLPIIWTYVDKSIEAQTLLAQLTDDFGGQAYFVSHMPLWMSPVQLQTYVTETSPSPTYTPYLPDRSDAVWIFDSRGNLSWNAVMQMLNPPASSSGVPFAGGSMPSYDRESLMTGGYIDARGTALYREYWEHVLDSQISWSAVITWDDHVEKHAIRPSSDWNWTRADLTAWYSHKLTGQTLSSALASTYNLYVTTPQRIRASDPNWTSPNIGTCSEGMVINDTDYPVTATITLYDGPVTNNLLWPSNTLGTKTALISPHSVGAVTLDLSLANYVAPASHFLRCVATATCSALGSVKTVTSAPILVLEPSSTMPRIAWDTYSYRRLYYSIPERNKITGTIPTPIFTANPVVQLGSQSTISYPPGNIRFMELLQNTHQAGNMGEPNGHTQTTLYVPITQSRTPRIVQGQTISTEPWGFYVTRVIDSEERVGYSDPVYFSAPTNLMINGGFEGGLSSWAYRMDTNASVAVKSDFRAMEQSNYVLLTLPAGQACTTSISQQILPLPSAGNYTIGAWIRSSGTQKAWMRVNDQSTTLKVIDLNAVSPAWVSDFSGTWQYFIGTVTIPSTSTTITLDFHADNTTSLAASSLAIDSVWFYSNSSP